ncbi:MAG: hypothetical protein IJ493_07200 [Clostridia bacterium]|nr:hypothetical protein [Clostridia bacterium]
MEKKTYKAGFLVHFLNVWKYTIIFSFIWSLLSIFLFDSFEGGLLSNLIWICVICWEVYRAVTVTVTVEGVSIAQFGRAAGSYRYEQYYFSADNSKRRLKIEARASGQSVTVNCAVLPSKLFGEMMKLIEQRQTAYFLHRRAGDGGYTSSPTKSKTAAEYSANNPYSKNYKGRPAPVKTEPAPAAAAVTAMPESPKIESPKVELPRVEPPAPVQVPPKPQPKKHGHGEDFDKITFRYPKRDIQEKAERTAVLRVLWILLAGVLFYLLFLATPFAAGWLVPAALGTALICVVLIAWVLISASGAGGQLFSKLEVAESMLIIDNVRYRWSGMSGMTLTPPSKRDGSRRIRFTYDGKQRIFNVGPCHKRAEDDRYFNRYRELAEALREKGFGYEG